ncbi:MAG: hypothetical protein WCX90_07135 [Thiohalomonadaceae bacterium]
MRLTATEFLALESKRITLLGMSGVGKTRISCLLRKSDWFHYSADFRIGTRYLDEAIRDNIKQQAMQVPFLRDLFRSDSIYIRNNITVDHLKPVSTFLGKLGNPEQGGLSLTEFKRRQGLHRAAEVAALRDVPEFIGKAQSLYGYRNFINDAGGSLCELDEPGLMEELAEHTVLLYIQATDEDERRLIKRAETDPKPLYYRDAFLDEQLSVYMSEQGFEYVAQVEPDDFARWVFARLFYARLPRYEAIAKDYGYTITTTELSKVQNEADFIELVASAIARQSAG